MRTMNWCCGTNLRKKCFIIAYINLVASSVDVILHVIYVALATGGFQCDMLFEIVDDLTPVWLQVLLMLLNVGTHGYYPLPLLTNYYVFGGTRPEELSRTKCYPGMIHMYQIDLLDFLINAIWLRFAVSFVAAMHKKDPEPIRTFFYLFILKLTSQVLVFFSQAIDISTIFTIIDMLLAATYLYLISKYYKELRNEVKSTTTTTNDDLLPLCIQSLINKSKLNFGKTEENKESAVIMEEGKKESNLVIEEDKKEPKDTITS